MTGKRENHLPTGRVSATRRMVTQIDHALGMAEASLIVLLLAGAAVLNFSQVAARYVFGFSASSLEEISVYLIVWMVFVGMAHADRLERNISLDIVHSCLPDRATDRLWRVADILIATTSGLLAWYAIQAVQFSHMIGEESVSRLSAPIWIVMLVIPVCFAIVACRAMARAYTGRARQSITDELDFHA